MVNMIIPQTKEEMFHAIYPYFYSVVTAFYSKGKWDDITRESFHRLKDAAKCIGLSAVVIPNGDDYILIVEKSGEYVIVSAELDIYTYEDEEDEAR